MRKRRAGFWKWKLAVVTKLNIHNIKKILARRNVNGMSHEKKKSWVLEMEVSSCYKIEYT
jgi:hypothetical protein